MKVSELKALVAQGEDSQQQFKQDIRNIDALAAEMVAFSNSQGGRILIGVNDTGELTGVPRSEIDRINQLISNAASQHVRSPISPLTENITVATGQVVIVLFIPKGIDKPYFDRHGVIWLNSGSDKRRLNSKEELRRLFQMSDQFHADGLPVKAKLDTLDKIRLRDFLKKVFNYDVPDSSEELCKLLQNMNLATDDGRLNLAGVLLFAERPEWLTPQFIIKAVCYPGNDFHLTDYRDSEDFSGPMPKIFDDALAFVMRNLHKIQAGRGVNTPGVPEIPPLVFEELLVNALVHRDYMISAPIRLFVFDNRIEIISPGHLPDNLTVEKIRIGNSIIRNPILVSYVAKGLLPYRGLGSGIKRALDAWPQIDFVDDRESCLFTAKVHRKTVIGSGKMSGKTSGKTSGKILAELKKDGCLTIPELSSLIGVTERSIERNIKKLQDQGALRRIGPAKGGRWEVP
jgi:ATP-dependent DNA helicase RecG